MSRTLERLVLLLIAVCYVHMEQLNQPASLILQPGQSLTINCKVSYSVTSYATAWIRQPSGKALEWINVIWSGGSTADKDSLKNKFSVSRDTSSNTITLQGQNMQPGDTAVYYCARYDSGYGFDYWGKGTMVTVSSGASSVPTSIFSLSQCGSDGGFVTLGCVMSGFLPADSQKFKWKDPSGQDLTDFIQYPDIPKDGKYSKISQIRVPAADWEAKKTFTCEVDGATAKTPGVTTAGVKKPEEILHIPTLYLMKPTSEEIEQNNTATFACLAAAFSPPGHTFKWKKEVGIEVTEVPATYSFTSSSNGNNSAISYLQVEESVWMNPGTKITCVFQHKTGEKIKSVGYSLSDDDCDGDDKIAIEVNIKAPSTEDLLVRKEGFVECKITGQISGVQKGDLEWRKNGQFIKWNSDPGLKEVDSSLIMKLKVTFEEWENGTEFSCFVPHEKVPSGITKTYRRQNGGSHRKPSVFLIPPPENEQSEDMTLTCYAKDFYPKEVFVSWLANDEPVDKSQQTDVINSDNADSETAYSVYSQLTIPQVDWQSGVVFSCVVYHENSDATVRMITRSIDNSSQKPNVVSLSMNVPQCRSN